MFKAVVNLFVYATDNLHARGLGYHIQTPKIISPDLEKKNTKTITWSLLSDHVLHTRKVVKDEK